MGVEIKGSGYMLSDVSKTEGRKKGGIIHITEPVYDHLIEPKSLRRMSRIMRTSVAAASIALENAGVKIPDAIVTGTGYGCVEDTVTFLLKMAENEGQMFNPTPFMQSTHNTIGSQIALLLQCRGYNQTYTQGALSFEHALIDSMMLCRENPGTIALTGAADEMTEALAGILYRSGVMRGEGDTGAFSFGEGMGFFVLQEEETGNYPVLCDAAGYQYLSIEDFENAINTFLKNNALTLAEIDCIVSGECGIKKYDSTLSGFLQKNQGDKIVARFKHVCGEYPVASAFALQLASDILNQQSVKEIYYVRGIRKFIKNVLIINQYLGKYHSMILLNK